MADLRTWYKASLAAQPSGLGYFPAFSKKRLHCRTGLPHRWNGSAPSDDLADGRFQDLPAWMPTWRRPQSRRLSG
jgi:hypothetical protein